MNILLINHYAGSLTHGMEYRPYYMAREWIKMGHNVTIIAASQSHLRSSQPTVNRNVTEENISGICYIWIKTPRYQGNGVSRVLNMLTFIFKIFLYAKRITAQHQPSVVIASSTYPLDNYPAYFIAKQNQAKLVYEVHDLWPLSPMELGGMSKWHPFIMVMQWAENFAYKVTDKVVSMLPKAKEHMCEHGMEAHKFVYIPNGIDVNEWADEDNELPEEHKNILTELKKQGKFIVGYAGAHGLANALHAVIDAASLLQNDLVAFVFVGQGSEKEKLQEKARSLDLQNVIFLPAVPKNSIPRILSFMDVVYIGLQRQSLFRFGVSPNKLMDYMMAAKPVIHAIEAGNDLVAESGCGLSVEPENPQAIAQATLRLKSLSQTERNNMGQKGREFVLKNHEYKVLAKRFITSILE